MEPVLSIVKDNIEWMLESIEECATEFWDSETGKTDRGYTYQNCKMALHGEDKGRIQRIITNFEGSVLDKLEREFRDEVQTYELSQEFYKKKVQKKKE